MPTAALEGEAVEGPDALEGESLRSPEALPVGATEAASTVSLETGDAEPVPFGLDSLGGEATPEPAGVAVSAPQAVATKQLKTIAAKSACRRLNTVLADTTIGIGNRSELLNTNCVSVPQPPFDQDFPPAPPLALSIVRRRYHLRRWACGLIAVVVVGGAADYLAHRMHVIAPRAERLSTIQAMSEASLLVPGARFYTSTGRDRQASSASA